MPAGHAATCLQENAALLVRMPACSIVMPAMSPSASRAGGD
jgi:hypothetical protein